LSRFFALSYIISAIFILSEYFPRHDFIILRLHSLRYFLFIFRFSFHWASARFQLFAAFQHSISSWVIDDWFSYIHVDFSCHMIAFSQIFSIISSMQLYQPYATFRTLTVSPLLLHSLGFISQIYNFFYWAIFFIISDFQSFISSSFFISFSSDRHFSEEFQIISATYCLLILHWYCHISSSSFLSLRLSWAFMAFDWLIYWVAISAFRPTLLLRHDFLSSLKLHSFRFLSFQHDLLFFLSSLHFFIIFKYFRFAIYLASHSASRFFASAFSFISFPYLPRHWRRHFFAADISVFAFIAIAHIFSFSTFIFADIRLFSDWLLFSLHFRQISLAGFLHFASWFSSFSPSISFHFHILLRRFLLFSFQISSLSISFSSLSLLSRHGFSIFAVFVFSPFRRFSSLFVFADYFHISFHFVDFLLHIIRH